MLLWSLQCRLSCARHILYEFKHSSLMQNADPKAYASPHGPTPQISHAAAIQDCSAQ
jgi:hypothetical protein